MLDIRLKLLDPTFGGAKLNGKLLSNLKGPLPIFFGEVGSSMKQVQCASRSSVQRVNGILNRRFSGRSEGHLWPRERTLA